MMEKDLNQLATQLITHQLDLAEKIDIPKKIIENTISNLIKDNLTFDSL